MKPILYRSTIAIRFSDFDTYGHVTSSRYLDYVISSRWDFAARHSTVSMRDLTDRKVGFYLVEARMTFRRPITGPGSVVASSHVERIENARLVVPYQIRSQDESLLYSEGALDFATIDLTTNKPIPCPDWVRALFFEEE